ncbi:unnamed protein product [Citrullus colocynthis]|uniref:Uncharacterized protein n=1 Tax=Citrullus colocynthis TaxID=252529 RepID=A0ABP0ZAP8_9ROSI
MSNLKIQITQPTIFKFNKARPRFDLPPLDAKSLPLHLPQKSYINHHHSHFSIHCLLYSQSPDLPPTPPPGSVLSRRNPPHFPPYRRNLSGKFQFFRSDYRI